MINGLAEKLRILRIQYNYSQKHVAKLLGVSPALISGYETGERMPSIENLKLLSQLYHCTSDYLLGLDLGQGNAVLDVSQLSEEQIAALRALIASMQPSSEQ